MTKNVKKRLLLHCCCAPCASYAIKYLMNFGFSSAPLCDGKLGILSSDDTPQLCCGENSPESYEIALLFYNPNIEPAEEYDKRKSELYKLAGLYSSQMKTDIKIYDIGYDNEIFQKSVSSYESEPEGGERCKVCFDIRLRKTAQLSKDHCYDIFATTLSVSPHKNAENINACGIRLSAEHEIMYLKTDFKKNDGYRWSVELSKRYKLYRQTYCGCRFSM